MLLPGQKITTSSSDDFLYKELSDLLSQIKLAQGGTALDSTLHRHNMLRIYLISKQIDKIKEFETKYFNSDGTLKSLHNS